MADSLERRLRLHSVRMFLSVLWYSRKPLAILAVQEVAYRLPPGFVGFRSSLAFIRVHATFRRGLRVFGFAASRAAVSEAGFIWLQLKLFRANRADSDRKSHPNTMITAMTLTLCFPSGTN